VPWLKLDDGLPEHPKFVALPDTAKWLWIVGLCYAGRYLTDGYIPDRALNTRQRGQARHLEAARLWIRHPDNHGWLIHAYLEYNPSREHVETERRRRQEAGRKGAEKRWHVP
jgi:hypothetical protein